MARGAHVPRAEWNLAAAGEGRRGSTCDLALVQAPLVRVPHHVDSAGGTERGGKRLRLNPLRFAELSNSRPEGFPSGLNIPGLSNQRPFPERSVGMLSTVTPYYRTAVFEGLNGYLR